MLHSFIIDPITYRVCFLFNSSPRLRQPYQARITFDFILVLKQSLVFTNVFKLLHFIVEYHFKFHSLSQLTSNLLLHVCVLMQILLSIAQFSLLLIVDLAFSTHHACRLLYLSTLQVPLIMNTGSLCLRIEH